MESMHFGESDMFGPFIIMYLFLGGCGAGILLASSAWSFLFHRRSERTRRESEAFRAVRNRCFVAGFVITCIGAACLLADLGRPERFLLLFLRPNQTYLTFGSFVLAALLVVAIFLCVANCLYVSRITSRMKAVAEVLCAIFSLGVMAYTGLFLQGLYAVAFWDTWLVPALFVFSAASMGLAGCLIANSLSRDAWLLERDASRMRGIHALVVACEAFTLVSFLVVAATGRGESPSSVALLFSDSLAPWFFVGVVACGLVVPLVCEIVAALIRRNPALPLADALCIFGGFALRLCIVSAGLH